MKMSDIRKKPGKLGASKWSTSASAASSPDTATKHDTKYPRQVALILAISHIIFAISIAIWHLHIYILKPNSFGYIVYLLEFPAAIILKVTGQAQNIDLEFVYIIIFIINSIFYGLLGYLLGVIFQKFGWDKEIGRLCKLETEIYEENSSELEPKQT